MVRTDYLAPQREKQKENWDGPYQTFRFDEGGNHRYEIGVCKLLVCGMTASTGADREEAVKYMINILAEDEADIYHFATILFSYHMLAQSDEVHNLQEMDDIQLQAWSGLQFILGRLHVRNHPALDKVYENIVEKVKMALDYLENSTQWFGEQGYRGLAEKNRWYKQWLERVDHITIDKWSYR